MKKGETMNNEKMTLKNVFSFEGCYTKKQYWVMNVGSLFGLVLSMLMLVVSKESEYEVLLVLLALIGTIVFMWIDVAASVKRLHDVNRSWYRNINTQSNKRIFAKCCREQQI
jgi:uncharacterized membrane protein YhaH (DUF805 family)